MATTLTHFSVFILAFIPNLSLSLPGLLIGAQMPDLEYFYKFPYYLLREKSIKKAHMLTRTGQGFLHSLLGSMLVSFPLSCLIVYVIYMNTGTGFVFSTIAFSVLIGLSSHLLLDLPAHSKITLFYPFFVPKKNPFRLNFKIPAIDRINPYSQDSFKDIPGGNNPEFRWLVLSHVILFFSIAAYLIFLKAPA